MKFLGLSVTNTHSSQVRDSVLIPLMPNPAISYAAVILADADVEVTSDKLLALINAANIEGVEPIVAQLYAKALAGKDVKSLLTAFATPSAAPAAAAGAAAGGAAAPAEEEAAAKSESESDEDMGMGLFD